MSMPGPRNGAPLVVFDFDHTLYDGDSGGHMVMWLLRRNPLRALAGLLASPLLMPMLASLSTRRAAISGYLWIGTVGMHRAGVLDQLIDRYVEIHTGDLQARLLPVALDVLRAHRVAGDHVVVATGAPPELARAILAFAAHQDLEVIGSRIGPRFGAVIAIRHCHAAEKVRMLREAGHAEIAVAYSDSVADLPLLQAAAKPVVVNPKPERIDLFRRLLPDGTPILNWGCHDRGGDPVGA